MGRRGPRPKPAELKKARGTYRKDRAHVIEAPPPDVDVDVLAPPDWFQPEGEAAREWRRLAPDLAARGLLTELDRAAFAIYCATWANVVELEQLLATTGRTMKVTTKSGSIYEQARPEIAILMQGRKQCIAWCREFGMTPSARGTMDIKAPTPDANPLAMLDRIAKARKKHFGASADKVGKRVRKARQHPNRESPQ